MDKLLRVDMNRGTVVFEEVPPRYAHLGGRALTGAVLVKEADPSCPPLSAHNKLVIAPGLLGGTPISSVGRTSIGAKSPLTGGIKESNAGGTAGSRLAQIGIRAVIVEGEAPAGETYVLEIGEDEARLVRTPEIRGMRNFECARWLFDRYGSKAALLLVGPAGELGLASACVACTDMEGRPVRMSGRGGLGAVMGRKGLKAIVVGETRRRAPLYDAGLFRTALRAFHQAVLAAPVTETYTRYGTAAMVDRLQSMGGLPTRNFSRGRFAHAEAINAETMVETILERGGEGTPTHACMPGCVVRCSNVYPGRDGREIVSPLEYENIGLLGSNCGIGDLDAIARLNQLCNDIGLDTIEAGAALAVAMEAGVARFGDAERAAELLEEIAQGTVLGRVLGEGAVITGRVLGVKRVPAVKGQAMPSYDPRAVKGLGVTYATSPMGADHTSGQTIRAQVDHLSPEGQARASLNAQIAAAVVDSLGFCLFVSAAVGARPDIVADLIKGRFGWDWTPQHLTELGRLTLRDEHLFNRLAGFSSAHDRLPRWMHEEALPDTGTVFDVPDRDLDAVVEELS